LVQTGRSDDYLLPAVTNHLLVRIQERRRKLVVEKRISASRIFVHEKTHLITRNSSRKSRDLAGN
jgi:hypothetical protein